MVASVLKQDPKHKRFKRTLFIRAKYSLGVMPFVKLQNDT